MYIVSPKTYAQVSLASAMSYIKDVESGVQSTNIWIKAAVKRGKRDRKSKKWKLDESKVMDIFEFCSRMNIPNSKGKIEQFILSPYQAWMLYELFLYYEKDGSRRFSEIVYFTGRKSGKTMIAAIIAFYMALDAGYFAPEIYFAATGIKQAGQLLKYCKQIRSKAPYIKARTDSKAFEIRTKDEGFFQTVANKVGGELDGKKPLVTIMDECHALPDSQLRSAFSTGMGWSTDALFVTISTAGNNILNFFFDQIRHGKKILETESNDDDKTLYILFTLDDGDLERDDITTNQDLWEKSNPNLGVTPPLAKFKADMDKDWLIPSTKEQFCVKNFNVFADGVESEKLFSTNAVNRNSKELNIEDFYGCNLYLGLDLAPRIDISSIAAVVEKDGHYYAWTDMFLAGTKDAIFRKGSKINFADYEDDINIAWGSEVTDYEAIVEKFAFYLEHFNIIGIGYDPAFSGTLISRITRLGIDCYPVKQYHVSYNETVMMLENLLAKNSITLKNNRILRFMFHNAMSDENKTGMRMVGKKESKILGDAVDSVVAILTAINVYIGNNVTESAIYQFYHKDD